MTKSMRVVVAFEDQNFVPLEITFLFLNILIIFHMLNYINILRIIFKLIGKLYRKVFKNIILLMCLNALKL